MTGRMMIRAMLVLLVVAATAMILVGLTACGGGSAQEQSNKPRPLPEKGTALRPSEYRSEEFEPSFSFRVGKGWSAPHRDAPDIVQIGRRKSPAGMLVFANVQQVYNPGKPGWWVEAPKDLVGWYQHHPYLQTTKPEPISVGGVKGIQFDVVVDLPKDYVECIEPNCVELFKTGSNQRDYGLCSRTDPSESAGYGAEKQRTIILEGVRGETVTIIYRSSADEFDEMAPEVQRVIDSVKWSGS